MTLQERMKEIMNSEAEAILAVEVTDSFEHAVSAILNCGGNVLTTGMGKAGYIAKKFAATLCSTGTPAIYVHPGEAAHGDLGLIGEDDCMIAFSTSGKTREVIETIALGNRLGLGEVVGITSHPDSELRDVCEIIIDMGEIEEPCPIGMTPSASLAVMLAISDAIALTLIDVKGFSKDDFGKRHHGGYLGKKARD